MLGADWVYLVSDLSKLASAGDALLSICWETEAAPAGRKSSWGRSTVGVVVATVVRAMNGASILGVVPVQNRQPWLGIKSRQSPPA